MKTFDLKSLLLGVGLTMMIVVVMLLATSNSAPSWEYQVVGGTFSVYQSNINGAAKEGWEVVGVAVDNDHPFAVMRRARAVQGSAWWKFWKK